MPSLKDPKVLAVIAIAILVGAAYGDRIPLVSTLARKLPGSRA